ncbi:MAG: DUF3793 family protein [Clostridiaceae bacterium]|jgi:hypothetical protein|nr:DUF3793 family protein [Clostridiaceae bacterium]
MLDYRKTAQLYFETAWRQKKELEYQLIKQCAPTLAYLKAASLFSHPYKDREYVDRTLQIWNKSLNKFGIFIKPIWVKAERILIYCYRKSALEKILFAQDAQNFLESRGYYYSSLTEALDVLCSRIVTSQNFPHEIGVFLDYPLGDVQGFIEHQGKNFKCCGEWKVYCNQKSCEDCFYNYKHCRLRYLKAWQTGTKIEDLVVVKAD